MNTMTTTTYEIESDMSLLRDAIYNRAKPSHSVAYWSMSLSDRANELRNRVAYVELVAAQNVVLADEIDEMQTVGYNVNAMRDELTAWVRKNAASYTVLAFTFGVIAFATIHAIVAVAH